ncbi:MAG: hypothetical protein DRO87_02875 [Candidatus Thorarchaeota archaeon]|nr:MAG: hypothetical protein DRP09_04750 [Candidatus Thorarchaeota archaeon]RLI59451.1 MAG: hypothetical protein DRO87_02875 [Candidatus Thorarchaeota archaeon]
MHVLSGHNIQAILIKERGGIPLFFMKLDPKAQDLDPILVSGFFTAIQSFSKEVIERDSPILQVNYGARLFTVMTGKTTDLVVVSMGEWVEEVTPVLQSLHEEFETIWLKGMSQKKKDSLKVDTAFPKFREGVIQNLSFRKLSGSWVPLLVESDDDTSVYGDSVLEPYIDGVRSIDDIARESGLRQPDVISEINRLWALGAIKFGSTLGKADIVVSNSKIDRLMQATSPLRAELGRKNPDALTLLPRLSALFDGRRTVGAIVESLSDIKAESEILQVMDNLMEVGAITALSPEKRRILLVKEAFELAVRVCEVLYSPEEALTWLNECLGRVQAPEVAGVIKVTGSDWVIDYDSRLYEGLDPRTLMDLYAEWMKLLAQFVSALDPNRLTKYAEALTDAFDGYLLGRYSQNDLEGFEEFSFWLELNCAKAGGTH